MCNDWLMHGEPAHCGIFKGCGFTNPAGNLENVRTRLVDTMYESYGRGDSKILNDDSGDARDFSFQRAAVKSPAHSRRDTCNHRLCIVEGRGSPWNETDALKLCFNFAIDGDVKFRGVQKKRFVRQLFEPDRGSVRKRMSRSQQGQACNIVQE